MENINKNCARISVNKEVRDYNKVLSYKVLAFQEVVTKSKNVEGDRGLFDFLLQKQSAFMLHNPHSYALKFSICLVFINPPIVSFSALSFNVRIFLCRNQSIVPTHVTTL